MVQLILIGSAVLFIGLIWANGYEEEGIRQLIRWSARISVSLFSIAFAAKGFHLWRQNSFSFWILMNRRYWGISFAIIHLAHLSFILMLQAQFHPVFTLAQTTSLLAGGLAYFFIVLMLLTSFPYFSKELSANNWKRLHTFGGYWIWIIFMSSYWKRVMKGEIDYLPFALLLVTVFLLRMYALYKSPRRETS